jgi:hypothetical protein
VIKLKKRKLLFNMFKSYCIQNNVTPRKKATDFLSEYLETTEGEKACAKNWSQKENGTCGSQVMSNTTSEYIS